MTDHRFTESMMRLREAAAFLPRGVGSDYRSNDPIARLVVKHATGATVTDIDENVLLDYYLGLGPMILGHSPPQVTAAIAEQLDRGILYGAESELEMEVARLVNEIVPCAELVRFTSTGSEAVQVALRVARAATGRSHVVRFYGHYHGWLDSVYGSAATTPGGQAPRPMSAGQDAGALTSTSLLPWNDADALEAVLEDRAVAAVLMEPVMYNSAGASPMVGYLERVRAACSATGTLLVFDEVITGFRLALGGAQELFGVVPDLAVFGKAIGSGMPIGCVAGRGDYMTRIGRDVVHGGTFNGHPVVMAAARATLATMLDEPVHDRIAEVGSALMVGLQDLLRTTGTDGVVQGYPAAFFVNLGVGEPIVTHDDVPLKDRESELLLSEMLLECFGIRVAPSGRLFLSAAHTAQHVADTLGAFASCLEDEEFRARSWKPAWLERRG